MSLSEVLLIAVGEGETEQAEQAPSTQAYTCLPSMLIYFKIL